MVATCTLHNFIRKWNGIEELFEENIHESLDYKEDEGQEIEEEIHAAPYASNSDKDFVVSLRGNIAQQMLNEH